jgi:hypothetical protein
MTAVPKTDTSQAAAAAQADVLRHLLPERRLELAVDMSLTARALLGARLRAEHPDWSETEVHTQVLRLTLAGTVLHPHPDDGG